MRMFLHLSDAMNCFYKRNEFPNFSSVPKLSFRGWGQTSPHSTTATIT